MRLSYSHISLLHDCGIAFENRYIKNIQTPKGLSAVVGTAVDASVNADLSEKMRTGSLLPLGDLIDIAIGRVKEQFALQNVVIQESHSGWMLSRAGAMAAAVDMAEHHHEFVAPLITPTRIQRYWETTRNGVDLCGYLDIQEDNSVRDTKTSYKSPYLNDANESKQLTMYAMAIEALDGKMPESVHLDYIVKTPARGEMKYVRLSSTRKASDLVVLDSWVGAAKKTLDTGSFKPAEWGHWMCSKKWCGYWQTCPSAQGRAIA